MHVVEQSEFPVYDGIHESIISEADWNLAQEKCKKNAYRREKVHDKQFEEAIQKKIGTAVNTDDRRKTSADWISG